MDTNIIIIDIDILVLVYNINVYCVYNVYILINFVMSIKYKYNIGNIFNYFSA